jgi:hypothetical protein
MASLPAIGNNSPLPATPRGRFAQQVAIRTGLNPWVIYAWTFAENTDSSVKRRPFNYLNFKSENGQGAVLGGVKSVNCDKATDGGCFPGFASLDDGVAATVAFINKHFPKVRQSANQPATKQIDVIGSSGWGTSASHLHGLFTTLVASGGKTLGDQSSGASIQSPATGVINTLETGNTGASGGGGILVLLRSFISFILNPHNWLRAGQIVAGATAILAGAFILARGEIALPVGR